MLYPAAAACGLTLLTAFFAASTAAPKGGPDYSSLPIAPKAVEQDLKTSPTSISDAIETVMKQTGGVIKSATFDFSTTPPAIAIVAYSEGKAHQITINTSDGSIANSTIIPRFAGIPVEGEPITNPSGLMYYDMVVGTGKQPKGAFSRVSVHYTGWLVDGTKFDSSHDRGRPYVTLLNEVIAAWTEGVSTMKVGGKRKLIVPARLGYGARGFPPVIPPNAMLIFDIELIDVVGE